MNKIDEIAIKELIDGIERAFSGRHYPGDSNIVYEAVGDPAYEGNQLASHFKGKSWEDLDLKSIILSGTLDPAAFIYLFTPDGFAYYMPAFLLGSLDVDLIPGLAETVVFSLTPSSGKDSGDWGWKQDHMVVFNPKERDAIKHAYDYILPQLDE